MEPAIRIEDLTLGYERHPAVHHLSGAFEPGSLTAVVGPNGAGKSTLLKGITGAMKPLGGRVRLTGIKRRDIGYLPQQAALDPSFPISVLDTVCLGFWTRTGLFGKVTKQMQEEALAAIALVDLAGFEDRQVGTLSRGQLQRVLFARLLVQDARVILLDEPFTALDERTCCDLLTIVKRWHGESRTVVAVLHDMAQVRDNFPLTLLLAREALGWGRTEDVLTDMNIARAQGLCQAWDDDAPICAHGDMV